MIRRLYLELEADALACLLAGFVTGAVFVFAILAL